MPVVIEIQTYYSITVLDKTGRLTGVRENYIYGFLSCQKDNRHGTVEVWFGCAVAVVAVCAVDVCSVAVDFI